MGGCLKGWVGGGGIRTGGKGVKMVRSEASKFRYEAEIASEKKGKSSTVFYNPPLQHSCGRHNKAPIYP